MTVAPGGLSTNTGTAVIIAPPSAPLVVTPEFHLTAVTPTVGATSATPGNSAGAANSTLSMPVPPRVITTVPQFSTAGASVIQTVPPLENLGAGVTTIGATAAGTPVLVVGHNARFDRGVSSGSSVGAFDNTGGKSLGEIARDNRQQAAGANARVYTNQDINRINQQPGMTVGGISGAIIGAGAAAEQQQTGNAPVVSQPSTNPPPTPGVSRPVPPANNPPDQSQANPPSPFAPRQAPREMAQANPPANPADQSAQTSASESQRSQRQLPSSGSILPLMALVGLLAAGAGLLAR